MASVEELKEALLRERIETADHLKNKMRHRKLKSINPNQITVKQQRSSLESNRGLKELPATTD